MFLTAVLLLGVCSTVAAKELEPVVYFSFDKHYDVWALNSGQVAYWEQNGVEGGCVRLSIKNAKQDDVSVATPLIKGETYRIEFWIRNESGTSKISPYFQFDKGYFFIFENEPVTENWSKKTATIYFDGTDTKGSEANGESARFVMRMLKPDRGYYQIDEFKIYPLGDIEPEAKPETEEYVKSDDNGIDVVSFGDTKGHWAETDITALATNGLLNGMSEGEFLPDGKVTRAEFIKMMVSGLRVNTNGYKNVFTDVLADDWFAEYIQTAYNMGILPEVMCTDGKILPNQQITREEAAAILGKICNIKGKSGNSDINFNDSNKIDSTLKANVELAVANGLIKGFDDGSFKPGDKLTRAQAATMQKRVVEIDSCITIYVDGDNGDDENAGTIDSPFKTIEKAQEAVKQYTDTMQNHIFIYLKDTEYYMSEPFKLETEDSGKNGYYIVYASYGGDQASITGGRHIKGWSVHDADKNIYVANVGVGTQTRQMFVDGVRAIRARSKGGLSGVKLSGNYGFLTSDTFLNDYKNISDLELVFYEIWTNPRCGVSKVEMLENGKQVELFMDSPGWTYVANKGSTSASFPIYYENAYELIDEGGEWYLDSEEGMLYYKPRIYEDMSKVDAVIPIEEDIVRIKGTVDKPVSNIAFYEVSFDNSTWMRPSSNYGHADTQSNHIRQDGVDFLADTAIEFRNVENVLIKDCTFTKLGTTALGLYGGVRNVKIIGNEFYDTSATAIQLGEVKGDYIINPPEEKYAIRGIEISDNYIHDVAIDYMSGVGIAAGFPKDTVIEHNEIYETPYSGMHLGYGWAEYKHLGTATENFIVRNNYVHEVQNYLFDGGGIYTLGSRSLNFDVWNKISENYIQNVNNAYAAIYNDNTSSGWLVEKNVINLIDVPYFYGHSDSPIQPACWALGGGGNSQHLLWRDNYTTTDYEMWFRYKEDALAAGGEAAEFASTNHLINTHVHPDANWPQEAQDIVDKAGLRSKYLERYAAPVQEIRCTESYSVRSGESFKLSMTAEGRKDLVTDFSSCKVYYDTLNPEVATVDATGVVTAHKQGKATIKVYVLDNDMLDEFDIIIDVDNVLSDIKFNTEQIVLTEGSEFNLQANGLKYLGDTVEIEGLSFASADASIASVDKNGKVIGHSIGETIVTVKGSAEGVYVEKELPVVVVDPETDVVYDLDKDIMNPAGWATPKGTTVLQSGVGLEVSSPSLTVGYADKQFLNETLNFGLQINATGGWPSIVLRSSNYKAEYSASNCYMLTFYQGSIELQRFNLNEEGKTDRTVIYGALAGYESVAGAAVPCDFTYNEPHDVQLTTKNEGDYVRIKVVIDGKEVINYLDESEDCIREQGYMTVYCRKGTMVFSPANGAE